MQGKTHYHETHFGTCFQKTSTFPQLGRKPLGEMLMPKKPVYASDKFYCVYYHIYLLKKTHAKVYETNELTRLGWVHKLNQTTSCKASFKIF